jgi:hypothetical protein
MARRVQLHTTPPLLDLLHETVARVEIVPECDGMRSHAETTWERCGSEQLAWKIKSVGITALA